MIQMTFELLVRKLLLREDRFIPNTEIKEYCKILHLTYNAAIRYLLKYDYVKRIIRGFFYVPAIEERKLKTIGVTHLEAVSKAMEHKRIRNWYFGFDTAIKLNKLTHEYFAIDYVVSDAIFRSKPITIFGHKVKFVKLNSRLFGFGTIRAGDLVYSDVEKTILDTIHIGKYGGKPDARIGDEISDMLEHASKNKLARYSKHYTKSVRNFVEDAT